MSRPFKTRLICHNISCCDFGPVEKSADGTKKILLRADQMEAMRLADLEGLSQNDAAEQMNVSRQTFGRIVEEARKIVAFAIVNGYTLSIDYDANAEMCSRMMKCADCGHRWPQPMSDDAVSCGCPVCGSSNIMRLIRCGKHCECPVRLNSK